MKWALWVFGIIVALIVLIAIIGALLPEKHTATRAAQFHQDPNAIWQAITSFQDFPSWRSNVKRIEPLSSKNNLAAWREVDAQGDAMPIQVLASDPPHRLVTEIADPKLPFGGTWTSEIVPAPGGCTVRITENGEIHNIIFRFMARFIFGYSLTMDAYLNDLGRKFGESPSIGP